MFWSLFIFHAYSTRELASIACDDEQGDLFYSAGPWKNSGEVMGRNEGEWSGTVEISQEEIPGSK